MALWITAPTAKPCVQLHGPARCSGNNVSCSQTWGPAFDALDQHGRRKEDCLQIVLWPPQTYSCSNTHNMHTLNVTDNFGFGFYRFNWFCICMGVFLVCLLVCTSHVCLVSLRSKKGIGHCGSFRWLWAALWVLDNEPRSSVWAVWQFEWEGAPRTHIFECSQFMELLGGIRSYSLAGGDVSPRVSFEVAS